MKKSILALAVIAALGFTSCNETTKEKETTAENVAFKAGEGMATATFGVRGNCGMCKATIEKAANAVSGVEKADWNVDNKVIKVAYDESKTDVMAIKKAIAASGYDTEGINGSEEAYKNLPGCCQYDHSMKMKQNM